MKGGINVCIFRLINKIHFKKTTNIERNDLMYLTKNELLQINALALALILA